MSLRRSGTTLIELVLAAAFLGIAAAIMLQCVSGTMASMDYAQRRLAALDLARDQLDATRSNGRTAALTAGTTTTQWTIPSLTTKVTVTTTIALVPTYTNLYSVQVTSSWTEMGTGTARTDSVTLYSNVEAPDS